MTDGRTDGHPDPKIGPQVYLGPIKMELNKPTNATIIMRWNVPSTLDVLVVIILHHLFTFHLLSIET